MGIAFRMTLLGRIAQVMNFMGYVAVVTMGRSVPLLGIALRALDYLSEMPKYIVRTKVNGYVLERNLKRKSVVEPEVCVTTIVFGLRPLKKLCYPPFLPQSVQYRVNLRQIRPLIQPELLPRVLRLAQRLRQHRNQQLIQPEFLPRVLRLAQRLCQHRHQQLIQPKLLQRAL